jgi:hypothetical protein
MSVDYSEKAVTMRIRQASQLRKLCLSLGKAGEAARESGVLRDTGPQTVHVRSSNEKK